MTAAPSGTPSSSSANLQPSPPRKRPRSPIYLLVTSSLTALFALLTFMAISAAAHKDLSTFQKLPDFAKLLLNFPWVAIPLTLPSILFAAFALYAKPRILLLTLSSLFLLIPFICVLYTFVSLLTPLYQYQPL